MYLLFSTHTLLLTIDQKNGAVVGALSLSHTSFLPSTELYEALDLDLSHGRRPDSYAKRSEEWQYYTTGLQPFKMPPKLDIREAAGMFDVWIGSQMLHSSACLLCIPLISLTRVLAPSDQLFLSKYCESDGNPREFVRRGLMNTLDS